MSSEAAPESAEGFKLPQPPYHLRPLLPSPILASKAPALPAPHAAGVAGWQCSTHLFPAAFPRSHALCISPAVPAPIVAPDERAQRVLDFAAWDEACAQWKIDEFYPPTSQAAALEDAKKLAAEQQKTPLWGVVQRWTNPSAAAQKDGIVIVAGHANGFHKECYEPYFTHLLEKSTVPLSEIWSMDTIDSGFSGVINQGKLGWTVAWEDHARDFLSLLAHIPSPGQEVSNVLASPATLEYDKAAPPAGGRRILALGHSYSGAGLLWTAYTRPQAIDGIVLIDAVLPSLDIVERRSRSDSPATMPLARGAVARKAVFESQEAAAANLRSKPFFQSWDPRALDLYLKHAFHPLPSSGASSGSPSGVTLAMPKWREAAAFANTWSASFAVESAVLGKHASRVHVVRMDASFTRLLPPEVYEAIRAEVSTLKGDHLVVQEQPSMLADFTAGLLKQWYPAEQKARL